MYNLTDTLTLFQNVRDEMSNLDLKHEFIKSFEPTMESNGFLRKDKIFHRIVNGKIVQLLSYYKYEGPIFTVQFSIRPLCSGSEYSTFLDDYRMCDVFPNIPEWDYDFQSARLSECMLTALQAAKDRLLPLLNSMTDYSSYIERINLVRPLHIVSSNTYMVNMALGNYDVSKQAREAFIDYTIAANQKRWGTNHHIATSTQKIFEQECEEYYRVREAMNNNDCDYIEQFVYRREQKSLNSYIKTFFSPSKYKAYLNTSIMPFEFVII